MSIIYEKELALAKRDMFRECGWSSSQWNKSMNLSLLTVKDLGFRDNYDVRRVADRFRRK